MNVSTKGNFVVNDSTPHSPSSGKASERSGGPVLRRKRCRSVTAKKPLHVGCGGGNATHRYLRRSETQHKTLRIGGGGETATSETLSSAIKFFGQSIDISGGGDLSLAKKAMKFLFLKLHRSENSEMVLITAKFQVRSGIRPRNQKSRKHVETFMSWTSQRRVTLSSTTPPRTVQAPERSGKASERSGGPVLRRKCQKCRRQISDSHKDTFRLTDNLRKRVDLPALAHLWANETIGQSCVSFARKRVGQSPPSLQTCWPIISLSCVSKLFGQCSEAISPRAIGPILCTSLFIFNNGLDGLTHYSTDLENEVWKLWNLHGFYSLRSTRLNHHCEGSVTHWLFLSSSLS